MKTATPLPVIVNRAGGTARRTGEGLRGQVEKAFEAAGQRIVLELVGGDNLEATLRKHASAPRLVIGGGDGIVASAAQIVADAGGELAILPLGMRNHFARQLGIPLDLKEAAALAVSGKAHPVGLGEAGGRAFISNASAGAYVDLAHERECSRLPRTLALVCGAGRALAKLRSRPFELILDGEHRSIATPLLSVSNPAGEVSRTGGRFSVVAVARLTRLSLLMAALRILAGKPRLHREFALHRHATEVVIEGQGDIAITFDGEACRMPLPLTLRIRPRALAVVQPEPSNG